MDKNRLKIARKRMKRQKTGGIKERMKTGKTNAGIGKQLKIMYVVAILIPITLLGAFLTTNLYRTQEQYHSDMLHSYNTSRFPPRRRW